MQRFAWFYVGYLVAVILFGAWVRITGAGAGCGDHWPMCNGEVVPQAPGAKTIIEFTHRVTSGLCGLFGLALLVWVWRRAGPGRAFYAALASLFFLLVEGFIGAVLVKKQLVVDDASVSRALVISIHLANTLLLTATTAAAAWWSRPGVSRAGAGSRAGFRWLGAALGALILTNITGAITALGDTLFPVPPTLDAGLFARIREDLTAGQHFLVQLRIVHPLVAAGTALFLFGMFAALRRQGAAQERLLAWAAGFVLLQVSLGVLNIVLAAPGWMQIVHLLVSQGIWILTAIAWIEAWPAPHGQRA
ncbi:MAG: COX15/CtaA family protein [Acidobacteriota bacterium]|jgi:heme A synthase